MIERVDTQGGERFDTLGEGGVDTQMVRELIHRVREIA